MLAGIRGWSKSLASSAASQRKMQINNASERNRYTNILATHGLLVNINNGGYGYICKMIYT